MEDLEEYEATVRELTARRIEAQKRTFTRWLNAELGPGDRMVHDIGVDLADGVLLCVLLEIHHGKKLKYHKGVRPLLPIKAIFASAC